jgi:hypothetical protein
MSYGGLAMSEEMKGAVIGLMVLIGAVALYVAGYMHGLFSEREKHLPRDDE